MVQYIKDGSIVMTSKQWVLLTFLLCFQTLAKVGLCIPVHRISVCTTLSLKFLSLNFKEGRDLRYHLGQPTVNSLINRIKFLASFEFDPDGRFSKIHIGLQDCF